MSKAKKMNYCRITLFATLLGLVLTSAMASATDLYWYLASSMIKPGKEIVRLFNNEKHPFQVILISGGSGQLLAKISSSHKGDLYTPAAMNYVQHVKKIDLLGSFVPLVVQTPVFALSASGKQKISSWDDLTTPGIRIGLGNPKTMALGKSYERIKEKMGAQLTAQIAVNKVVEGVNVSQIFNYLKTDIIDAGITFDSTARAGNLDYIHIPAAYNHKETAPLIRLTNGENRENTTLFTEFIFANMGVFEKYGFTVAGR